MKKIALLLFFLFMLTTSVYAERVVNCDWIYNGISAVNSAPTNVFCEKPPFQHWKDEGASYIQDTTFAHSVGYQIITTWDGVATLHGVTVCENTVSTGDVNFLHCIGDSCDTGTTTVAYFQVNDVADGISIGDEMTVVSNGFKITVDEDADNTCFVVKTRVLWK